MVNVGPYEKNTKRIIQKNIAESTKKIYIPIFNYYRIPHKTFDHTLKIVSNNTGLSTCVFDFGS